MSDQKPVKRDAAWLAAVNALITEHRMAVISFHQKQIPAKVLFAKRQAIDAMLLAPDPRDACVDALRNMPPVLQECVKHVREVTDPFDLFGDALTANAAAIKALRALDGDQPPKPDPRTSLLGMALDELESRRRDDEIDGGDTSLIDDLIASIKQAIGDRT